MRTFFVALLALMPLLACAQAPEAPKFEEGKHYTIMEGQPKPAKTGKIEVMEFFWYGCGHCYKFEEPVTEWKKKLADDVAFVRSPAMWTGNKPGDPMSIHARIYYTASALGSLEKLHSAIFDAMHVKNMHLTENQEIKSFVDSYGLNGDAFVKTMDSFAVNAQVTLAETRQKTYKIGGTPEMVVGGYYHVSTVSAGGQEELLQLVDFLVEKIRKER